MGVVVLSLCSLARGSPVLESAVSMVGYRLYGRSSSDLLQEDLYQRTTPPRTAALSPPDPMSGQCPPTSPPKTPKNSQDWYPNEKEEIPETDWSFSLSIQLYPSTNTYREKGQVSTQSEVLSISWGKPHRKPTPPASWSWTSRLRNCEK